MLATQNDKKEDEEETTSPVMFKGKVQHDIARAYYREQRDRLLEETWLSKHERAMLSDEQTRSAHWLLLQSPTGSMLCLNDNEFTYLLLARYGVERGMARPTRCEGCMREGATLWHRARCTGRDGGVQRRLHNRLQYMLGGMLARCKGVVRMEYEAYVDGQVGMADTHRPDIVLTTAGDSFALDVSVQGEVTERNKNIYLAPLVAYRKKQKIYEGVHNAVPVVFDVMGRVHDDSWRFVHDVGLSRFQGRLLLTALIRSLTATVLANTQLSPSAENNKDERGVGEPGREATPLGEQEKKNE